MECSFTLEKPNYKICLGITYSEAIDLFKGTQLKIVNKEEYLVVPKVTSLGSVKHDLGLHFLNQKLTSIELFFFDLSQIETDDEFTYINNQLIKMFGPPTASALQEKKYPQNQWIIGGIYEVTNNQTAERGQSINIGSFNGAILTGDGMWKTRP